MRKNFGPKPWTYPQPVFILAAYDENGVPNAMNAAWGGISEENEISLCISEGHKTTQNILARKAFTISMADAAHVVACDYVGIVSGNNVPDKMARAGFHTSQAAFVDAPVIDELPMTLECRLIRYEPETCRLVGEIVNVSADEAILDGQGMIDPDRFSPIIFDPVNHTYRKLGEVVGTAFADGAQLG
ncbi:flavin reductase family protein [Evtepia sp.]|nr:flavin reductase family protein [Candidatus Evtepia faecavium]